MRGGSFGSGIDKDRPGLDRRAMRMTRRSSCFLEGLSGGCCSESKDEID